MNNTSPGRNTHSRYGALENSGNCSVFGSSTSTCMERDSNWIFSIYLQVQHAPPLWTVKPTWLVLWSSCDWWGYSLSVYSGEYKRMYLLPTTWGVHGGIQNVRLAVIINSLLAATPSSSSPEPGSSAEGLGEEETLCLQAQTKHSQ